VPTEVGKEQPGVPVDELLNTEQPTHLLTSSPLKATRTPKKVVESTEVVAAEALTRQRGGELLEINVDGGDSGARRFYERYGYVNHEPGQDQPLLHYYRELGNATS